MTIDLYICFMATESRTGNRKNTRSDSRSEDKNVVRNASRGEAPETKSQRTRAYICERSAPVFNKRGVSGTSLGDLTEATGLTKGALYGHFKDKAGIALAVFDHSMKFVRAAVDARLVPISSDRQKLLELLSFFEGYVMHPPIPGGCPMMNYGIEADDHQRFMRKAVAKEMQSTIHFIERCLERGKASGEFTAETRPLEMAQWMFCAIEGAIAVSRVSGNAAPMQSVVAHCRVALEQLSR